MTVMEIGPKQNRIPMLPVFVIAVPYKARDDKPGIHYMFRMLKFLDAGSVIPDLIRDRHGVETPRHLKILIIFCRFFDLFVIY